MRVLKFGGTSVADAARILRVAGLVKAASARGPVVVVTSAMSGVTNALLAAGRAAEEKGVRAAEDAWRQIARRHRDAVDEIVGGDPGRAADLAARLDAHLAQLEDLLRGVGLLRELSPRAQDAVASFGERLNALLLAEALLTSGAGATPVDASRLIITDAEFGAAAPDLPAIRRRAPRILGPILRRGTIAVVGGFYGSTPDGVTTTLGRGGSDYSAALLAAALPAEAVEIWTDVDGMLTCDPRIVPEARLIPRISAAAAAELARFGAKVIHPATIGPAVKAGIPVLIKNTFAPNAPGTVIVGNEDDPVRGVPIAVAAKRNVAIVSVSSPEMLDAAGYMARIWRIYEEHEVSVDLVATTEVSVSATVEDLSAIPPLLRDLRSLGEASAHQGCAIIAVVGKGFLFQPGLAARIFSALGEINVLMISQGAKDNNVSFVVDDRDLPVALRRVHTALFDADPVPDYLEAGRVS